jgi:glutamate-ammonia-ligase adenylyltransferase
MVFLHGNSDYNAVSDGPRQVSNDQFYARLGQRMIHIFTTRTPSGQLYEADMRLRPDGNSGLLVSALDAFERYQRESAWTWEHQALLRARPVAGDAAVTSRFSAIRRQVLSRQRTTAKLRQQVREMREKMRASMDRSGPAGFDIKQGAGGIADIEFMVQYCVLRWAHAHRDLLDWTDNIRLLEGLGRHRLLPGETVGFLADAYRTLRARYHRNALEGKPGMIAPDQLVSERQRVQELWQEMMVNGA